MMIRSNCAVRADKLLGTFFQYAGKKQWQLTVACFFSMLAIMIGLASFDCLIMSDAFYYLLKSFEIHNGNWEPYRTDFIGWPMFNSFFLKISGTHSLLKGMFLSRFLSIFLMAAAIFPFSALVKKLLDYRASIIAILAFSFSPVLTGIGTEAMTEPLFVLLSIFYVYFLTGADTRPHYLLWAAVFAGLSYYVRANGLFLLAALMIYTFYLARQKKAGYYYLLMIPMLFFLISVQHLYARYIAYGSPFDYGNNSKYFIDSYDQVWTGELSVPTFFEYLRTHSWGDYFNKFIFSGLFRVISDLFRNLGVVWSLLFLLGSVWLLIVNKNSRFRAFFIVIFIFIIGLTPVFHVYGDRRHLITLLPLCLIISSLFLSEMLDRLKGKNILTATVILLLICQSPVVRAIEKVASGGLRISVPHIRDQWATWVGDNLKGTIAMRWNQEIIRTYLIEKKQAPVKDQVEFAKQTGVYLTGVIGNYKSIQEAYNDFKNRGINYLLVSKESLPEFGYLREMFSHQWSKHFVLLQSFKSKPGDRWMVDEMYIFIIRY